MSSKKKAKKTYKVLVLDGGKEYDLVKETGKYWVCNGAKFNKSLRNGKVETRKIEQPEDPKKDEE